MSSRALLARSQLEAALAHGFGIEYTSPSAPADRFLRRSAVLILFGALDDIPAGAPTSPVSRDLDVLLTRRSDAMRHHPGQIAFPGGGVENGDADLSATALREAAEETGLDPSGVDVLGQLAPIHIPVSDNLVTPVIGWWRLPSEVAADHSESVDVFRVPVAELLDPGMRGTAVLNNGTSIYRGAAFELTPRFGSRIVWGFTGMLLSSILAGVGWEQPWNRDREFTIDRREDATARSPLHQDSPESRTTYQASASRLDRSPYGR